MVRVDDTSSLCKVVSVENFRSVLNLEVDDLEDRWGSDRSGGDRNLDDIRGCVSERERRNDLKT